ncbi:hypothetical protein AKJ18_04675 [Vibrio xuii]|nr:hypothetical protein AKJ18_04675 [Vibrio xuii]
MKNKWEFIEVDKIVDSRGSIQIAELGKHFHFDTKRIYFLSDIVPGEIRGEHAHEELNQLLLCIAGSFEIELDDGKNKLVKTMTAKSKGILLDGMVWRTMRHFSKDAVMLALCDRVYSEDKVIRDYKVFINMLENR